jgi:predicted nucleotidyltransferase
MNGPVKLWNVLVGSHAFGANHAGSDYDYFGCYVIDSFDLLSGRIKVGGCHVNEGIAADGKKVDRQNHELSRWVDGAMEENLNYMIGLFSPYPVEDPYGFLAQLRELVSMNRTTGILASALGMARSNLKKMEMHNASGDEGRALKNLRSSIRALWFARRFVQGVHRVRLFDDMMAVRDIPTGELLETLKLTMEMLEEDADRSSLPSKADAEPFYDFQLNIRLNAMRGNRACYGLSRKHPGGE